MQEERLSKAHLREARKLRVERAHSYRFIKRIAEWMDKYYLDPILGFVPAGDVISGGLVLPYLYVAFFKVQSIPLTLAVLCNVLMDIAMGLIPFWIGDVLDFFHKSYRKNYELILGFVEGDEEMIKRVNKRAIWMVVLLVVLCILIYFLILIAGFFYDWLAAMIRIIFG